MSAFVVDPMDAQKPWQMSLGPLLRLWPKSRGKCHSGLASSLGPWSANSHLSSSKASEVANKSQIAQNGWHNATIGNKHRCQPLLWTQWMPKSRGKCHSGHCFAFGRLVSELTCSLSSSKASKVTNKSQIEQNGWHGAYDREQTQMSAFVVDPMDAQKPWQMSLGPLLCLWALEKYVHISAAPKLAKLLTKAKSHKMGGTTRR